MLGHALPVAYLQPLPPDPGPGPAPADAPSVPVIRDRRSDSCRCVGSARCEPVLRSVRVSAAVQGNNEVSIWDMETGDRKFTLWASSAPPLSEMQVGLILMFWKKQKVLWLNGSVVLLQPSPHSVHGIYCSPADGNPLLLTAGSDMRIR